MGVLAYKSLGHYDDFGMETVCWVGVSSVPEDFINEAKEIGRRCYSDECFGVCICYDREKGTFTPAPGKAGCDLYYVDNNGDRHWFPYELAGWEMELLAGSIRRALESA